MYQFYATYEDHNHSGCNANDLLRGCQPSEKDVFCTDVQMLLGDCSRRERQMFLEITAAVKQILRDAV